MIDCVNSDLNPVSPPPPSQIVSSMSFTQRDT